MNLHEVYKNSGLGKWFHGESATKEPGWDRYNSEGKRVGKCGDAEEGAAYSACLSKQKAKKLGKKGVGNFVKRKRAAQNKSGRGEKGTGKKGKKPIFVKTGASKMEEYYHHEQNFIVEGKNKPNDPEKWSECKSAAKSKFDVYPSAYANAWASKCYKKKGGTWRSVNEDITVDGIKQFTKFNILNNFMENAIMEGKIGSDKEKMEDPSSVGPPIDQAIIDAASLGGSTPLRITPNVEKILRDEQAFKNQLDKHINNYADYVNDLTKNIRLRNTSGFSRHNMFPEEGTR